MDERDTTCSQQYLMKVKDTIDDESFAKFIDIISRAKDTKSADVRCFPHF